MKKWCVLLALLMLACMLFGCMPADEPVIPTESSDPEIASSEPDEVVLPVNPLTGLPLTDAALLTRRPVAVMVNNIRQALPQSGLSKADIIYELPVEGGITRLMAVFSDYKAIEAVGSVRSCRHDYVELALPLNAIYVHFGWSNMGKDAIAKYGVDNINGIVLVEKAFYFDEERAKTKSSEHCWFTNAEYIQKGIDTCGYDTSCEPLAPLFSFTENGATAAGQAATRVTVPMSNYVTATFTYDAASGCYLKGQFGEDHVDALTGKAVGVKNVFLMYTDVKHLDASDHKEIALESGKGYYLSEGKAIPVTFCKDSAESPMKVFGADGAEITVNAGTTWFSVASTEMESKLVIE